ncbi:hypothetical protein B0H11DRAFT_2243178 [Mycena galericulata]|nr:hypothetical protein B0H11DRAFT_2243178 [Mycena galericulata]
MSAEELRVHIQDLSGEIELQKVVLKTLEDSKVLAQRQLNAVLDPVARLPFEISSEIFLQCIPPQPEPKSDDAPLLLLSICSAWTDIALATPALWAAIRIVPPRKGLDKSMETWFRRARNQPLSIAITGSFWGWDNSVATILRQQARRIKDLEISDTDLIFGGMGPDSLPSLKVLTSVCGSIPNILGILRCAPTIVNCTLTEFRPVGNFCDIETLVLPALRELDFGNSIDGEQAVAILKHLILPALQTLRLPGHGYNISHPDLASFLKRSSPPLHTFSIGYPTAGLTNHQLDEYIRPVPTITHFRLTPPDEVLLKELFDQLAHPSSSLLPNLRRLEIEMRSFVGAWTWTTVLRALSARRSQVTHFTFLCAVDLDFPIPDKEMFDALEKLEADGMEIYIGTAERVFFSV